MSGDRFRRPAQAAAALGALVLTAVGTVIAVEAVAHLGGYAPVTFGWPAVARRLGNARLGQRWVEVAALGLFVVGVVLLVLSTARGSRRQVPLSLVPPDMAVTLDAADARSAAEAAAESVPAVGRASARWTIRRRVRVKVRYARSDAPPGREVDELVEQRVAGALKRLAMQPRRGVKVKRSRRSP